MLTCDEYLRLREANDHGAEMPSGTLGKLYEFEEANNLLQRIDKNSLRVMPLKTVKYKLSRRQLSVST